MDDDRDRGIEFGDLADELEEERYPLTAEELRDRYGDRELEHASGTTTLREVLTDDLEQTFDGPDAVHEVLLSMVGEQAVGREGYSDRGAGVAEDDDVADESF